MLTILHSNDIHNRLSEAQAHRLHLRRSSLNSMGLLLDAGDAVFSGNITYRSQGERILERMSWIGYDAMTVGNREFHFSERGFYAKLRLARFPVLCANVTRSSKKGLENPIHLALQPNALPVQPYTIFERSNLRIAVFGLTVPMITPQMAASRWSAFHFQDPLQIAKRWVSTILSIEHPDLLIALTHIGLEKDRVLAESCQEIDLIVGGHSHDLLERGEQVGRTLIVQAGSYAEYIGTVKVKPLGDSKSCPRLTASVEAL